MLGAIPLWSGLHIHCYLAPGYNRAARIIREGLCEGQAAPTADFTGQRLSAGTE